MIIDRHQNLMTSLVRVAGIATAMLMLTVLIVTRSEAAFSDTTTNTTNSFTTGSVELVDDDTGNAMFNVTGMAPGATVTECIALTYNGTLAPADVRMYASVTDALGAYLTTTVDVGTGGGFGSCAGFSPTGTMYSGSLAAMGTTHSDWTSGAPVYTAATTGQSATVRITVELDDVQAAQGEAAQADFTFEAQNN